MGQDFAGFAAEQEGSRAACRELETEFASRPVRYWLDLLSSFDVPCAEVAERPERAASEIVTRTRSLLSLVHPAAGDVQAVGAPFEVSGCAPWVGDLPSLCTAAELSAAWSKPPAGQLPGSCRAVLPVLRRAERAPARMRRSYRCVVSGWWTRRPSSPVLSSARCSQTGAPTW